MLPIAAGFHSREFVRQRLTSMNESSHVFPTARIGIIPTDASRSLESLRTACEGEGSACGIRDSQSVPSERLRAINSVLSWHVDAADWTEDHRQALACHKMSAIDSMVGRMTLYALRAIHIFEKEAGFCAASDPYSWKSGNRVDR